MQTSPAGLIALARHEAVVLSTYKDSVGVLTIGVGHTAFAGDPQPVKGMRLTPAEAIALLRRDLAKYERQVAAAVKVPLEPHEFDALVSFHYNTGAIASASLVRKLNAGDRAGAAAGLMAWVNAGGRRLQGLVNRRTAERALFERGDYGELSAVPVYDVYPGKSRLVPAGELFDAGPDAAVGDPPAAKPGRPLIRLGDTGDAVVAWQSAINADLEARKIEVTGAFDEETDAATRGFQRAHGLKDDGIVGEKTWGTVP